MIGATLVLTLPTTDYLPALFGPVLARGAEEERAIEEGLVIDPRKLRGLIPPSLLVYTAIQLTE